MPTYNTLCQMEKARALVQTLRALKPIIDNRAESRLKHLRIKSGVLKNSGKPCIILFAANPLQLSRCVCQSDDLTISAPFAGYIRFPRILPKVDEPLDIIQSESGIIGLRFDDIIEWLDPVKAYTTSPIPEQLPQFDFEKNFNAMMKGHTEGDQNFAVDARYLKQTLNSIQTTNPNPGEQSVIRVSSLRQTAPIWLTDGVNDHFIMPVRSRNSDAFFTDAHVMKETTDS